MLKISIIVPIYNEFRTFDLLMTKLLAKNIINIEKEIILVESNSNDGTKELVQKYAGKEYVRIIYQASALGKGNAVREGLKIASGDIIIIQDADLEYDIDDYDKLVLPIAEGRFDFILGSRNLGCNTWQIRKFEHNNFSALVMNVAHLFLAWIFNSLYGVHLKDPFTMFKVFRKDAIKGIEFECDKFDFDNELVGKLIRRGHIPIEIPVNYWPRDFTQGKKISFLTDPPTWIWAFIKYRFFWK